MADDLDAELLALAGDSEEEHSPPPKDNAHSPAQSASSAAERDHSSATMGRKGTAKSVRRSRKVKDEDGEM